MLEVFEPGEVYPGSSVETEKQWEEYVTHNINIGVSFFFFFLIAQELQEELNGVRYVSIIPLARLRCCLETRVAWSMRI